MERNFDLVYPYPAYEDVLGFYSAGLEVLYDPILAVDLSFFGEDSSGRVCFFYDADDFILFKNRLFEAGDIAYLTKLSKDVREDLFWFWGQNSYALPVSVTERNRYFRILYQIYFKQLESRKEEIEEFYSTFLEFWPAVIEELRNQGIVEEESNPLYQKYFWWEFWNDFQDRAPLNHMFDLSNIYHPEEERKQRLRQKRQNQFYNKCKDIDTSIHIGYPSWFQGLDYTPVDEDGEELDFLGQFWTDDLGYYTSKLLYLFYCSKYRYTIQKYDFD